MKLTFVTDYARNEDYTAMIWVRGTDPIVVERTIVLTKEETRAMMDTLIRAWKAGKEAP